MLTQYVSGELTKAEKGQRAADHFPFLLFSLFLVFLLERNFEFCVGSYSWKITTYITYYMVYNLGHDLFSNIAKFRS